MWNDNIPVHNYYFYYVVNRNTKKTALFPSGDEYIISHEVKECYKNYKKEITELKNKYQNMFTMMETSKDNNGNLINPQGYSVYPRVNYCQKIKKKLQYDFTEYPCLIKMEWRKKFVGCFDSFMYGVNVGKNCLKMSQHKCIDD